MLHLGVCTCAQPLLLLLLVGINDTCLQPQVVRRLTSLSDKLAKRLRSSLPRVSPAPALSEQLRGDRSLPTARSRGGHDAQMPLAAAAAAKALDPSDPCKQQKACTTRFDQVNFKPLSALEYLGPTCQGAV